MSQSLVETIRSNAEVINALNGRIHDTFKHRDRSRRDEDAWSRACAEFHRRFRDLVFPGGETRWEAFFDGDSSETESAIAFLEVDPRYFRSGYLKQIIWNRLKRCELTPAQEQRLEAVGIAYLSKWHDREFWDMVRYVRARGSTAFWAEVGGSAEHNPKARWLLLARQNHPVRTWLHQEWLRAKYEKGYTPDLTLASRTKST